MTRSGLLALQLAAFTALLWALVPFYAAIDKGKFARPAEPIRLWAAASNPANLPEGQAKLRFGTTNARSQFHPRSE